MNNIPDSLKFSLKSLTDYEDIDLCVVQNDNLTSLREDFECYYKRFSIDNFIFNSEIEQYVNSSQKKYVVLFFEGIIFKLVSPTELLEFIQHEISEDDWAVKSQIKDEYNSIIDHSPELNPKKEHKYFLLHPTLLIVDVEKIKKMNILNFGRNENIDCDLVNVDRSLENIHDNYTPLWIKQSTEKLKRTEIKGGFGWNLINECLKKKYTIRNISKHFRSKYIFTYPDNDIDSYIKTFDSYRNNMNLIDALNEVKAVAEDKSVFSLFNSEKLTASNYNDYDFSNVDICIVPCQGFKDMIYCQSSHTKIIHYDVKKDIVWDRQVFNKLWDGKLESIKDIVHTTDWPTSRRRVPNEHTVADFTKQHEYDQLVKYFNNFEDAWKRYQSMEHHYLPVNLFDGNDLRKLLTLIDTIGSVKILFFISDIFPWRTNFLTIGKSQLIKQMNNLLDKISSKTGILLYEGMTPECGDEMIYTYG